MKTPVLIFLVVALAALGGWLAGHQHSAAPTPADSARKVLFYQSPMHPWIKSDQPGNCTICGMKLVPVFEGDAQLDAAGGSLVKLSPRGLGVMHVESAKVTRQPLRRTIRVAGMIEDDDSRHRRLSAYVDGRIDKLFVNFVGAEVTAGQPLAAIYSRDLLVARSEYTLVLKQSASQDRDVAVAASRQKLRRLGLTMEQIEKLPAHTGDTFDIVAPITGTVVERKVYEGQYVKEGDVLFEIADFSRMWFVFDVYERDLAWIRVGLTVAITTPLVPGKVYRAPVSFIDPNLVPQTRSAKIRVVLENPDIGDPAKHRHELLHKVFAEGALEVETPEVLAVPRSAVLSPGGAPLVYVVKGEGQYEFRAIRLGRAGDEVWEVLDGLSEGESVVTTGNLLIDAQAQLDRGDGESARKSAKALALEPRQVAVAGELFAAADALAAALAADDLKQYNLESEKWRAHFAHWIDVLGVNATQIEEAGRFSTAANLAGARKDFLALSAVVADFAVRARRQHAELAAIRIFECPMAKAAVPSASVEKGRWLQLHEPLRNPFFGAEMLTCGTEVKP